MNITIGADPEVFMGAGGKPVSAYNAIPGTKKRPFKVNCGAVQVDGMALEFNIDPVDSEDAFVFNINTVMAELQSMIPNNHFIIKPSVEFGKRVIDEQPREAVILGCDPDFNAYKGGAINSPPNAEVTFRTAAGHIHVGWGDNLDISDPSHILSCCVLTKAMDHFLAFPSLVLDRDKRRRTLYGKAGAFRPKPYGMEYRVLSNFWLKKEEYQRWVYKQTIRAIEFVQQYHVGRVVYLEDIRAINNVVSVPKEQLMRRIERYKMEMPKC